MKDDSNGNGKFNIWDCIITAQKIILFIVSIFVVFCIGFLVIFRYLFKIDLFGIEEIVIVFAFWMYFIGGSYAAYKKNHINVDIVTQLFKNTKHAALFNLIVSFITTILCLVLTYYGFNMFAWSLKHVAKTAVWQIPWYIPQSSIFVGYFLMSFYFITYFVTDLRKYICTYKTY